MRPNRELEQMGLLRKAIFLVFALAYLIIAPLTVLYALGYIFSPSHSKLMLTGLISLDSDPPQAEVWLNDVLLKDTTPVVIRNLKPGLYTIHLSLPGMHPWKKQIEIKADKVISFEKILLFPSEFQVENLTEFPITKIWHSPRARNLIVLQGNKVSGLYLFEPDRNQIQPIFPHFSEDYEMPAHGVLMHPLGERAAFLIQQKEGIRPFLVEFLHPIEMTPLAGTLQEPFNHFRWGASRHAIFFLQNDSLKKLDFEEPFPFFRLREKIRGFTTDRRQLFAMDHRRRFLELTEKGEIRRVLLKDPLQANRIFGPDEGERYSIYFLNRPFIFTPIHEALALFLSGQGELFSNRLPYFLDKDVEKVIPAASHQRAIYQKDKELWLVDFEREPEKTFFQIGLSPRKVYAGGQNISNVIWFYDDRYLLFVEGDWMKVIDFEGAGEVVTLIQVSKRVLQIALDEGRGFVYFVEPTTRQLSRIQLFTPNNIFPRLMDEWAAGTTGSKETE